MQAIQTFYKGYHFRSRLEARWAVFFDALDLDWQYEIEGFQLNDGTMYLPDFKITTHVKQIANFDIQYPEYIIFYVEVKPKNVISDEKFDAFNDEIRSDGSYSEALLVSGDPMDVACVREPNYYDGFDFLMKLCGYEYTITSCGNGVPHDQVLIAARRARSARFEHGESGGTTLTDKREELMHYNDKWKV